MGILRVEQRLRFIFLVQLSERLGDLPDTHSNTNLARLIARNIAETQVEVIASCMAKAPVGFDTLTEAAKNATDLLVVREALEANDEMVARRLA